MGATSAYALSNVFLPVTKKHIKKPMRNLYFYLYFSNKPSIVNVKRILPYWSCSPITIANIWPKMQ